jgi:hypothetical protein
MVGHAIAAVAVTLAIIVGASTKALVAASAGLVFLHIRYPPMSAIKTLS